MLAFKRVFEVLPRKLRELIEHVIEAGVADCIESHGRGRHRGEPNLVKTHLLREMPKYLFHVDHLSGKRHPRSDRTRAMNLDQLFDLRGDHVIASLPVMKDSEAIVRFFRAVDADRHADVVLGEKESNDRFRVFHNGKGSYDVI